MKKTLSTALLAFGSAALVTPALAESAAGKVRTTAYTHTESDHIEYGKKTASGSTLKHTKGYTSAAADWSKYPVGTKFKIKGMDTTFVVDDYGSALVGTETIDIYQPSRSAMNGWGVRNVDIHVIEKGDYEKSREILSDRTRYSHVREMLASIEREKKNSDGKSGWFFRNRESKPAPDPKPIPAREQAVMLASTTMTPAPKAAVPAPKKTVERPAPTPSSVPSPEPVAPALVVAEVPAPAPVPATIPAPAFRKIRPLEVIEVASADRLETAVVTTPTSVAEPKKRAFRPL